MVYVYNGILLNHKKNEILPFVTTRMDLESIMLNEMSDRARQTYGFTYMWTLKNKTNEQTHIQKTETGL